MFTSSTKTLSKLTTINKCHSWCNQYQSWQTSIEQVDCFNYLSCTVNTKWILKAFWRSIRCWQQLRAIWHWRWSLGKIKTFSPERKGIVLCGLWFVDHLTINATAGHWKDCLGTHGRVLRCDAFGSQPMYVRWNNPRNWTLQQLARQKTLFRYLTADHWIF